MKKFGAWLAAAAVVALASCVTINIYFPAAAAERAADQVIEEVWQLREQSGEQAPQAPEGGE
jgi:hypothetical protein